MVIKALRLENAANTIVGNGVIRGVSGGEKRRLTIGEMLVGVYLIEFHLRAVCRLAVGMRSWRRLGCLNVFVRAMIWCADGKRTCDLSG